MSQCEEYVYEEEYRDYILEYLGDRQTVESEFDLGCIQEISNRFAVVYQPAEKRIKSELEKILIIPRCFGLMNSYVTLEESGVTKVQRTDSLGLSGQGVLVGFVDTGAGVWNRKNKKSMI